MFALGLVACGHIGIDETPRDPAEDAAGVGGVPPDPSSGGKSGASGGRATGGDSSGGASSGDGGMGGLSSGGTGPGGEASDGGDSGSGGAASGGSDGAGGSGETTPDCNLSDPICAALVEAMVNHFSFSDEGTTVIDSLGQEPAIVHGATMNGSGLLTLSGTGDYVELPAGLISALPSASFEIWFVWHGGAPWQRLFEFGNHDATLVPVDYLFATPQAGGDSQATKTLTAGLRHLNGGERQLRTSEITEVGVLTQVVLIADDTANRLTFYKNGQWLADLDTDVRLDGITDDVNSLGKSLFSDDPYFDGEIADFRIYGAVLTAAMVAKSYELGADAIFPTVTPPPI